MLANRGEEPKAIQTRHLDVCRQSASRGIGTSGWRAHPTRSSPRRAPARTRAQPARPQTHRPYTSATTDSSNTYPSTLAAVYEASQRDALPEIVIVVAQDDDASLARKALEGRLARPFRGCVPRARRGRAGRADPRPLRLVQIVEPSVRLLHHPRAVRRALPRCLRGQVRGQALRWNLRGT